MIRELTTVLATLCLLTPLCARAQADISPEAVENWQIERDESQSETYRELMTAFDGEEWDGTTVVSLAGGEDIGAASVERDGAYVLAMLEKDADGWRVTRVNETLLDMPELPVLYGVEPEAEGEPWKFQIRPDDDFSNMIWLTCEGGVPSLYEIDLQEFGTVQDLVPEIRKMTLETAYIVVSQAHGGMTLEVYAQDVRGNVLSDRVSVDPAEFDVEAKGMSQLYACAGKYVARRNDPPFVMSDGTAYALPQPQLAKFKQSKKYPVYTGPGTDYAREANGKASVSTKDWVQVFGEENGWLLVQYAVRDGQNRFGYIKVSQRDAGVSVPTLSWKNEETAYSADPCFTTDPLRSFAETEFSVPASGSCRRLATLGGLAYVETVTSRGVRLRAFVSAEAIGR